MFFFKERRKYTAVGLPRKNKRIVKIRLLLENLLSRVHNPSSATRRRRGRSHVSEHVVTFYFLVDDVECQLKNSCVYLIRQRHFRTMCWLFFICVGRRYRLSAQGVSGGGDEASLFGRVFKISFMQSHGWLLRKRLKSNNMDIFTGAF